MEISCGPNPPENCTYIYQYGDRCRNYVSCKIIDGNCQPVFSQKFDNCKACVEKCLQDNPGDAVAQGNCESECD
jgi:hypothetical protein